MRTSRRRSASAARTVVRAFLRTLVAIVGATLAWQLAGPVAPSASSTCEASEPPPAREVAEELLRSAGLSGGLCSHVGCGDGELTAELARSGRMIVHALDADPAAVAAATARLRSEGLYGPAWVEEHRAQTLPYAEDLVNLVVLGTPSRLGIPLEEVVRVLCPGGIVFLALDPGAGGPIAGDSANADLARVTALEVSGRIESAGLVWNDRPWLRLRKPWPPQMDEWSHPRHGPDGNAFSADSRVGPPRRLRWVAGPLHESSNLITAGGRLFCGGLVARDAFNGLRLWDREIDPSPMRLGYPASAVPGSVLPVASGSLLFAFERGAVRALDAVTGRDVRSYPEAGSPVEILCLDGTLVTMDSRSVRSIEVETGTPLWSRPASEPGSVVAGDGSVFFLDGDPRRGEPRAIVRVGARTGEAAWRRADHPWLPRVKRCSYRRGVLLCEASTFSNDRAGNAIHALAAADGSEIWQRAYEPGMSHYMQARAIHANALIWVQAGSKLEGIEPSNGKIEATLVSGTGHCYPPVATERYFLAGEMSLTDLASGQVDLNPISKGNCSRDAGFVPANGLIYCAPKHCTCWPLVQGYVALAPARGGDAAEPPGADDPEPLVEAGPALERGVASHATEDAEAWPCYRADAWRSSGTATAVPAAPKPLWKTRVGGWPASCPADWLENPFIRGPITPPVIAEGLAIVAAGDQHRVVALDARTGERRWEVTVDGRIDSPPTIWSGLCLFGTRSGRVWCLRARDGGLAWRLRVGPRDERIVSFGQIESPWPVPGSVLVSGGVAYFAGGRHPLSDGGIRVIAADPREGRILWRRRIVELPMTSFYGGAGLEFDPFDMLVAEARRPGEAPRGGGSPAGGAGMPTPAGGGSVAGAGSLGTPAASAEGPAGASAASGGAPAVSGPDFISLSRWRMDPATGEVSVSWRSGFGHFRAGGPGRPGDPGVMAPRGVWTYGPRPEYVPSGPPPGKPDIVGARPRPLVAFRGGTLVSSTHDKKGLLRHDFTPKDVEEFDDVWFNQRDVPRGSSDRPGDRTRTQRLERGARWTAQVFSAGESSDDAGRPPGEIAALVLVGEVVFVAGTGGRLIAVSAADGRKLSETEVPPPVWDGMAAASGRLYVSTRDGDLVCLGGAPP